MVVSGAAREEQKDRGDGFRGGLNDAWKNLVGVEENQRQ